MTTPITGSPASVSAGFYGNAASATDATLDKQAFLDLLVTQLRNQDPSSPMDSNELMAQQTQMATMEQLTDLAAVTRESFALQMRTNAAGLIGQQVSYIDGEATVAGTVTAVSFAGSVPTITVDGQTVRLDSVSAINS